MKGIYDIFPEDQEDAMDPISLKKLETGEGWHSTRKCILGFDFDGVDKTLRLEKEKRAVLLTVLQSWLQGIQWANIGIPFGEFESVSAKLWHAFTAIPAGKGLLSLCNWVLQKAPAKVYLHQNKGLLQAIQDARTLLRSLLPAQHNAGNLSRAGRTLWG